MTSGVEHAPWVGRPLPRVEDDALLRGEGRFLDDLQPVPHARHAAIVRSLLPHARITVDLTAALELPGVVGVLTGDDVRALSQPFPAGIDSPLPHYAPASTPFATSGSPSPSSSRTIATSRRTPPSSSSWIRPLEPILDPVAAASTEACVHDRSFEYGQVDAAMAEADLVVRETFHVPRFTCLPVECYAVVADWDASAGRLTAWSNFQGPFTLHGVAAAALRLRGDRLRLITPPDSGGSFGIKSSVFGYVVLVGLASRKLGVPVRWIEDRLEHLAASAASTARVTEIEAGFTAAGELIALRYDAIEDVGAYVRAPEPATLYRMHGSLSGAYRVRNVAARNRVVLTNTLPSGSTAASAARSSTSASSGRWRSGRGGSASTPSRWLGATSCRPRPCPTARPSGALYDSGDYAACLDEALELSGYAALRTRAEAARSDGRLAGVGIACIVEPSVSNMGYITLAQTAAERAATLPKSGNAEGAAIAIDPLGGITVRLATTPQGQGHRTVCAQVVADALGCDPQDVTVMSEMDTATVPWTVASGNYSSRFSGVGIGAVQAAALKLRAKIDAIRAHAGDDNITLRRVAGMAHWNPEGLPEGMEPGLSAVAFWSAPNLDPPDADDRVASSAAHGIIVDVCAVEVDPATGEVQVLEYVTVHDAGILLNPLLADGQVREALPTASQRRSSSAMSTTRPAT